MGRVDVLVTGGAGFIGGHLVRALVKAGYSVRVLDNLSTGSLDNIGDLISSVEFVKGDVRDFNVVKEAARGVDAVVHLAALVDVAESFEKPDLYFEVNVKGTYNVVRACRGVRVLVYASSYAVYGEPSRVPTPEDHPTSPNSPYALSKVYGEALVEALAEKRGYRPVVLRFFNVYGPGQSRAYAGVVLEFVKRVSRGEPPVIYGDGSQTRDFIHVRDAVKAVLKALVNEGAKGVFNVGSGVSVSINELAKLVLKLAGREDLKPVYAPPRPGDVKRSQADISRARRVLGFEPRVKLEDGIRELLALKPS